MIVLLMIKLLSINEKTQTSTKFQMNFEPAVK